MSLGMPIRPIGTPLAIAAREFGSLSAKAIMFESNGPGAMAFTVM